MPIVCATKFSGAAHATCSAAALLAQKAGETLWLVHVQPTDSVKALGKPLLDAAEAALEDEARTLEKLGARVQHALLTGEPATAIRDFAMKQGATLVVTAAPSRETPFLGLGGTVDRLAQSLEVPLLVAREPAPLEAWARGERPLKEKIPRAALTDGRKVEFQVASGSAVADMITEAAELHGADIVCMGTHGRTGIKRAVMGSVAQAVMARSDRPVVLVRSPTA